MQTYMLAAGSLALIVGAVHSLLGEMLIFRHLRNGSIVPALGAPPLRERHVRILWGTWHLATVLGWGLAVILLRLAAPQDEPGLHALVVNAITLSFLASSILVLVATKGRHPGWIGLLAVAALTWLG